MHTCGDTHPSTFDAQQWMSDLKGVSTMEKKQWAKHIHSAWRKRLGKFHHYRHTPTMTWKGQSVVPMHLFEVIHFVIVYLKGLSSQIFLNRFYNHEDIPLYPSPFIYLFNYLFIYLFIYFIVVDFVIHWNETAMGLHVFPIPIPPPTSLSTWSL